MALEKCKGQRRRIRCSLAMLTQSIKELGCLIFFNSPRIGTLRGTSGIVSGSESGGNLNAYYPRPRISLTPVLTLYFLPPSQRLGLLEGRKAWCICNGSIHAVPCVCNFPCCPGLHDCDNSHWFFRAHLDARRHPSRSATDNIVALGMDICPPPKRVHESRSPSFIDSNRKWCCPSCTQHAGVVYAQCRSCCPELHCPDYIYHRGAGRTSQCAFQTIRPQQLGPINPLPHTLGVRMGLHVTSQPSRPTGGMEPGSWTRPLWMDKTGRRSMGNRLDYRCLGSRRRRGVG
jgi:hypothetical protein